ncbi:ferredoxin [Candidatus Woesearchaeota archaeon]|nr:ferredoxin [Candidatus Woesearchaeota archaeon]
MSHSKQQKETKIEHDRENCIGCTSCAAIHPKSWKMNEDGKADFIGEEDNFELDMEAAQSCPVNVIHVIKKDKKLI